MFSQFDSKYFPDLPGRPSVNLSDLASDFKATKGGLELFANYAGMSFNKGVYRIHLPELTAKWNSIVSAAFPDYSKRIVAFGADWLGRQFALDRDRIVDGELQVLLMEPGTGEALEVPTSLLGFHETELILQPDAALATSFFQTWLDAGHAGPDRSQCVGYKIPLFLGGKDVAENLELTDMEVYWSLCGQLLEKVRKLPPGTPVRKVSIS